MQAVGPLLAFRDPAREEEFEWRFHNTRLPLDRVYLSTAVACDVVLVLLKLVPHGRWDTAVLQLLDALPAAVLLASLHAGREAYLQIRTALIAALQVVHALISTHVQPLSPAPTCGPGSLGLLPFWAVELMHQLVPWTAIYACVLPLPIKHAVWSQAGTAGMLLLPPFAAQRLRVSLQLCPTAGACYSRVAALLSAALAKLLPPPLAGWIAAVQPLPDAAAYYLLTSMVQVLASFAAPLLWLAVHEWRARLEFARSQRDTAAVASLRRRARQWQLGAIKGGIYAAALGCIALAISRVAAFIGWDTVAL